MMNVLYVTGEAAPYAVSGGLGDVMGALPKSVKRFLGKDSGVGVILPLYTAIASVYREKMQKISEFWFYHSWRNVYCAVYRLEDHGVNYYFVDNEYYFKRGNLYGDFDDGERFAYFSHAVLEFILHENLVPDILHANDWQAALSIVYAKLKFGNNPMLSRMKTVFTIHNIEYQGKFGIEVIGDLLDLSAQYTSVLEYDGCLNLLKGAMICADRITTVSPNYKEELRNDFFAFGLQHVVQMCMHKMDGVINGIDTNVFSSKNEDIPVTYSFRDISLGKAQNKVLLQEELGLSVRPDVPLISMITRLTEGKGVDLVLHIFEEMLALDIQFVLLGTGDKKYEQIFEGLAYRHRDRARALIQFDRRLSKRIYAASDIFLMPSKTEPCGLAQMIACAYGTVPIVRNVGGLHDSIIPYGKENANGFRFDNFNAHDLLFKVKDAVALYRDDTKMWDQLRRNALRADFRWKISAQKYIEIYTQLKGMEKGI